jgi:TetR/AcrR family transcriptional repressor of nem operon
MTIASLPKRPRGRPAKNGADYADTRAALVRAGMETLTEHGLNAGTLDIVLTRTGIPKGSFYHYFENKNAFVDAALTSYAGYFARKLARHFAAGDSPALLRLQAFIDDAADGMARHDFRRGCLVGHLGQEVSSLDEALRERLEQIFKDWELSLTQCLLDGVRRGEIDPMADCPALAHAFWVGWEGAILRARLTRSAGPLRAFTSLFFRAVPRPPR